MILTLILQRLLAPSTIAGMTQAQLHYNNFACSKKKPLWKDLTHADVTGEQGQKLGNLYASYLVNLKQGNGRHFVVGSKVQF